MKRVWYALGLLARNEGNDAAEADKIITNTIRGQYRVESEEWFGNYQQEPEEPYVGLPQYPPSIYVSNNTQGLILESLYNATKGDEYRFGNLDKTKDNLYPAYSNPSIMRAFVSGWTGRRLKECNMTRSGERYAQEIIDLFNLDNTLSEFNSGTYTDAAGIPDTFGYIYVE
ncbi:hypothetical protein HYQ44_019942 [Verticillium longisporum]|nr:hypothetical protein HYQ44_019942 [Verticillium longisporum]